MKLTKRGPRESEAWCRLSLGVAVSGKAGQWMRASQLIRGVLRTRKVHRGLRPYHTPSTS
jgi:hypothetical protein